MTTSSATARKNMVDCQIQTNGVVSGPVLEAFRTVPRESFLPPGMAGFAYNDQDIPLGEGRYILSPMTQARLIEVLEPKADDVVLNIGDCTGYVAAILSGLAKTVVSAEGKPYLSAGNTGGCKVDAPYTAIILNGSVSHVPAGLLAQLSPGGRLVCIMRDKENAVGALVKMICEGDGHYSHYSRFDAAAPWVEGFEPRPQFFF